MRGPNSDPRSARAVAYAWQQLGQRAGLAGEVGDGYTEFASLGLEVHYGCPEEVPAGSGAIVVVPCGDAAWTELLTKPPGSIDWLPAGELLPPGISSGVGSTIPVLFWGGACGLRPGRPVERRGDGSVVFWVDLIATTLFMLTRWEEIVTEARDEHGRFPASASLGFRHHFLDRPIVDEYSMILRRWMEVLRPGWRPRQRAFGVYLSHDVDSVALLPTLRSKVAALIGSAVARKPRLRMPAAVEAVLHDPHMRGINDLARLSRAVGLRSAFYFQAGGTSRYDGRYQLSEPVLRATIRDLIGQGCEVGLHPSYETLNDPGALAAQRAILEAATGVRCRGGRQHVLRFSVPGTWRDWERAGLEYDSTLGYADHEGFRAGTCHPYRPFDIQEDRMVDLLEVPLIVMDVTLKEYRCLSVQEAERTILLLAHRCREVEGTFTLLWHNSSLSGEWGEWGQMYATMNHRLAKLLLGESPTGVTATR